MERSKPFLLGICGGSGSGKTTLAKEIVKTLGESFCSLLSQDHYYKDQSHRFDKDGGAVNFDHPDALDFKLMAQHLESLKRGENIEIPQYDFATHTRSSQTRHFASTRLIIVDGILIFSQESLVHLLDYKVFLDVDESTRFERRLKRDLVERGRSEEGIRQQLEKQVLPMHNQFVGPSKKVSDFIIHQNNPEESHQVLNFLKNQLSLN